MAVICAPWLVCAQESTSRLLRQLDEALSAKQTYEDFFFQRINALHRMQDGAQSPAQVYELNGSLATEFSAYSLDSTLFYLERNRTMARSLQDPYREVESDLRIAREYALAGLYSDAMNIFSSVEERQSIPAGLERLFYDVGDYLYGELAVYSSGENLYWERRSSYRSALMDCLDEDSYEWLDRKRVEADGEQDREQALEYALKALSATTPNSRSYARAAYFVSTYQDDEEDRIQWLARSALADVLNANKDYASLNELASLLYSRGDIDRAFRYVADHCMPDALTFNGKLRPWQIAQFFPRLEQAYAAKNTRTTRMLTILVVLAFFLLVSLAVALMYVFRRNSQLSAVNGRLTSLNSRLTSLNGELQESNKVRQEYIALFLSNLSENISTSRQYKNHVLKYIRRGNDKYLIEEIEALPPLEEDIQQFNKMFDRTFINLYPDFVEHFNALLAPGEEIVPKGDDILTPELRVFALIKLGITESSRIASLLHYSANTVYNYRAKIKNKSRGDRDHFEQAVRAIE